MTKLLWGLFGKSYFGIIGVQIPHGGAIGRFEVLDDGATKTVLKYLAQRVDGTIGATGATSSSDAS